VSAAECFVVAALLLIAWAHVERAYRGLEELFPCWAAVVILCFGGWGFLATGLVKLVWP